VTAADGGGRDPGEPRLEGYLEELRENPPRTGSEIVGRVNRSVRWQRALREPLLLAAQLAGAVIDGIKVFRGPGGRADRR
jgi:hypothetical protein